MKIAKLIDTAGENSAIWACFLPHGTQLQTQLWLHEGVLCSAVKETGHWESSDFRAGVDRVFSLLCCYEVQVKYLFTDVSGQPVSPIFKGQAIFDLENGTDKLFWNVVEQLQTYVA